ncbi:MAG TPA: LapA family protein, partial [Burkholderiaceae bacterium]|nr:LapA family protein [Burkholderiaceae bacterium]
MRAITWLLRAAVFFVLFAFALNNQQEVTVHWFFGLVSQGPMVFVVLAGFALGCVVGVLAMTPRWWQQRRRAQ